MKATEELRRLDKRQYAFMEEVKARQEARAAICGRSFKCGPWEWKFATYLIGNVEWKR